MVFSRKKLCCFLVIVVILFGIFIVKKNKQTKVLYFEKVDDSGTHYEIYDSESKKVLVTVDDKSKLNLYLSNPDYIDMNEEQIVDSKEQQEFQSDLGY